jgi:hypothetical protein
MHAKIIHTASELIGELDKNLAPETWRQILQVFVPTHVADSLQIQQYVGLDREKFRRVMDKLQNAALGLPPIFHQLDHSITRPGVRGRRPGIYLLGETGALLLNELGYPDVHPCRLNTDLAISHALAMLDIHQTAMRENIPINTDCTIEFGDHQNLRPDHQINLPDGQFLIYEIEQVANKDTLTRIRESLTNKHSFFDSAQATAYLREIRMLLNLAPNSKESRDTIQRWARVYRALSDEEELGFALFSMPLGEFLINPDWSPSPSDRWVNLSISSGESITEAGTTIQVPVFAYSDEHSAYDDCIVVNAADQEYKTRVLPGKPKPDFGLFKLAIDIYDASHAKSNYWALAGIPYASINMLKILLEKREDLLKKLNKCMNQGRHGESPVVVVHHMQGVIDCFLNYYAWESGSILRAEAINRGYESHPFGIVVNTYVAPSPGDGWENKSEIDVALAWVLSALFKYAEQIGLDKPRFLS